MVELRVTVDDKLNKLLDEIVASGLYQSKAELMRSATVYLLIQMDLVKEHIQNETPPKKNPDYTEKQTP
jgi:Arc/MetJ-type ribon-helix-helix transcriptional regulator